VVDDHLFEIPVGGRDDPDVDGNVFRVSNLADGFFLNQAQQFDLKGWRELADFVQKESSFLCCLHESFAIRGGPRESPLPIAKEFTFDQCFGHPSAVDNDKRVFAARALPVDGLGHKLLAGTALARYQDIAAGGRHTPDELVDLTHGRAFTNDAAKI